MALDTRSTRLPKLPENWRGMAENIDPKTGKPMKRRQARTALARALPGTSSPTALGTPASTPRSGSTGGPGQGAQYDPASSGPGGARTPARLPSAAPGGPSAQGNGSSVAETSGIPGPLGTLEPHGQQILAEDPVSLFGQILPGGSMGPAAGYFGSQFNPQALLAASGVGGLAQSNESYLAAGQAIADEFANGAGAGKFLNPVEMMNNLVAYAQQVMDSTQAGSTPWAGGPLAALADMQPWEALDAFVDIVEGAMMSTMPEDVAASYAAMLRRVGQEYVDDSYQTALGSEQKSGMDVINFLQQRLGPNMGLAGGGTGSGANFQQISAAI